jgi:ABC-type dipeptide/oligopeptide/nickel transport system permease component
MGTYLIRRALLMIPTLIGATMLVFFVVAAAPGGITAVAFSSEGMRPEQRRAREEYLSARYGLDKPLVVQYLRWLNKVSPIGFRTWEREDPAVRAAAAEEAKLREAARPQVRADVLARAATAGDEPKAEATINDEVERELRKRVNHGPDAGDVRLNRPALKTPDLGDSFARGRKVSALIAESLPITLLINTIAIPVEYVLAVVTGVWAARHRGKMIDVASGTTSLALWSLPQIWVAVLVIGFLANDRYLHLFPTQGLSDIAADTMAFLPGWKDGAFQRGWLLDFLWHLVLPVLCISYGAIAFLHKLSRASLLDTIQADFVRTARAKGVSERVVLWAHAFRNSLIPLITVLVSLLPAMITGSLIVETVFGINGMGKLTYEAINQRDRELFLSNTLIVMVLTLGGFLLADILYVLVDPRVSYE